MSFTCPGCGAVSHHPDDVTNRYCGRCHQFWNRIGPGVEAATPSGELHVDIDACLIGNGYEPNDQTRAALERCWLDVAERGVLPAIVIDR